MDQGTEETWLSVKEAAKLAKVSVAAVRRWIRLGHIAKFRADNGYHVRLNKAEVLSFAAWRRTQRGPSVREVDSSVIEQDQSTG